MTSNPSFLSHGGKPRAVRNTGCWVGGIDGGGGNPVLKILKWYLNEIKVSSLEIIDFQMPMIILQSLSNPALCHHYNPQDTWPKLVTVYFRFDKCNPTYTFHCLSLLLWPSLIDFIFCDLPLLLALTWVDCFL